MTTKQDYIIARQDLVNLNIPMNFMRRWCEDEGRDFNSFSKIVFLMHNLHNPMLPEELSPQRKFISGLVDYLDRKYKVTLVFDKNQNFIKCI
jgi:hypothetical protein